MTEDIVLQLKNKTLVLQIKDFGDLPIDTEDLLQVDYNNIIGDIITFPVIFNRIALLKAEVDNLVREVELDIDIYVAQKKEEFHKSLVRIEENSRSTKKVYPTDTEVKDAVKRTQEYKVKMYELFKVKKEAGIIDGLYWSAKSKDKKLDNISAKVRPEEFESEILEGTINSVIIKSQKNLFKSHRE